MHFILSPLLVSLFINSVIARFKAEENVNEAERWDRVNNGNWQVVWIKEVLTNL